MGDLEEMKKNLAKEMERLEAEHQKLNEQLKRDISSWRENRDIEAEVLKALKEKQQMRKGVREQEEMRIAQKRRLEVMEQERLNEERKAKEQEEKMKRMQEALKKQQEKEAAKAKLGGTGVQVTKKAGGQQSLSDSSFREELSKTKEQLEEEKKMKLSFRIVPLDLQGHNKEALKAKALELWDKIVNIVTEYYDLMEHQKTLDYDLREMKERQRQMLRQRAMKLGLEPEALTGKYPPKVPVAAKGERREDTRTYDDKKKLFDGGLLATVHEQNEKFYSEKIEAWSKRPRTRFPKWFGERPGRKKDDPETPEEEEEEDDLLFFEEEEEEPEEEEEQVEEEPEEEEEEEEEEESEEEDEDEDEEEEEEEEEKVVEEEEDED